MSCRSEVTSSTMEELVSHLQNAEKTFTEHEEHHKEKYSRLQKKAEEEIIALRSNKQSLEDLWKKQEMEIDELKKLNAEQEHKSREYEQQLVFYREKVLSLEKMFKELSTSSVLMTSSLQFTNADQQITEYCANNGSCAPPFHENEIIQLIINNDADNSLASYVTPAVVDDQGKQNKAWKSECDMVKDFQNDDLLCLNGVCALDRKKIILHGSDMSRKSELVRTLTNGNWEKKLTKKPSDLSDSDLASSRMLARKYALQLFRIYTDKSDPFFPDFTTQEKGGTSDIEPANYVPKITKGDVSQTGPSDQPRNRQGEIKKSTKARGIKKETDMPWPPHEEKALAKAWLQVYEDKQLSKRKGSMWGRVCDIFHQRISQPNGYRNMNKLSSKWRYIKLKVKAFDEVFERKRNQLLLSDVELIRKEALSEYEATTRSSFELIDEWESLRASSSAWDNVSKVEKSPRRRKTPSKRKRKTSSSSTTQLERPARQLLYSSNHNIDLKYVSPQEHHHVQYPFDKQLQGGDKGKQIASSSSNSKITKRMKIER